MDKPTESTNLPMPTPGSIDEALLYRIATGVGEIPKGTTPKQKYLEKIARTGGTGGGTVTTLDGMPIQNLDFIEGKVVQEGLVGSDFRSRYIPKGGNDFVKLPTFESSDWTVLFDVFFPNVPYTTNGTTAKIISKIAKFEINLNHGRLDIQKVWYDYNNGVAPEPKFTLSNTSKVALVKCDNEFLIYDFSRGIKSKANVPPGSCPISGGNLFSTGLTQDQIEVQFNSMLIYNRPLSPSEISHNFQVLNNTPSVTGINADGKEYAFSTDSNHVTMDTGYNVEETIGGIYEACSTPFTGVNGKVEIGDAIAKSKILSGEISGNTVKNSLITQGSFGIGKGTGTNAWYKFGELEVAKTYWLIGEITDSKVNDVEINFSLNRGSSTVGLKPSLKSNNGKFKSKFTVSGTIGDRIILYHLNSTTTNVCNVKDLVIVEDGMQDKITSYIPFGLTSTEATISTNSTKHSFYEPTITGTVEGVIPTDGTLPTLFAGDILDLATGTITFADKTTRVLTDSQIDAYSKYKKVILLNKAGDFADKIELKEDGSSAWNKNTMSVHVKRGNGVFIKEDSMFDSDTHISFGFQPPNALTGATTNNIVAICCSELFKEIERAKWNTELSSEVCAFYNRTIVLRVLRSRLTTQDINGFLELMNGMDVECIIPPTPTTTHIPKSLTPVISLNKINTLSAGGSVSASDFKGTYPKSPNVIAREVAEVKAILDSPSNLDVTARYVEDEFEKEYNNLITLQRE